MGLPKKNTLNTYIGKTGLERQDELINMISDKSLFFPKGISIDDLDGSVTQFVQDELSVVIEGEKPPTIFMAKERWADFMLTKKISDEQGNVIMPFFTIKRDTPPQPGSNEVLRYTISQNKKFTYAKVPTFEDGKFSLLLYKIPQPTAVDLTYEFRFYTKYMEDLNRFNENLLYKFASGQVYVLINGYYMPIMMEENDFDLNMEFDGHNFYTQPVILKLIGFLQDPKTFEMERTIRNVTLTVKAVEDLYNKR